MLKYESESIYYNLSKKHWTKNSKIGKIKNWIENWTKLKNRQNPKKLTKLKKKRQSKNWFDNWTKIETN